MSLVLERFARSVWTVRQVRRVIKRYEQIVRFNSPHYIRCHYFLRALKSKTGKSCLNEAHLDEWMQIFQGLLATETLQKMMDNGSDTKEADFIVFCEE